MMRRMSFIARADEDKGDLFAWWDGSELTADTQFQCNMNEAILVLDANGEETVATLGPGRHALPAELKRFVDGGEVIVIFITTSALQLEAEGVLEEHEDQPWVEIAATFTVRDAAKALELLPHLDDDETPEDWLSEELVIGAARVAAEHGGDLAALRAASSSFKGQLEALANEDLAAFGLSARVTSVEFSESEDE